jgi:hypothetical protein
MRIKWGFQLRATAMQILMPARGIILSWWQLALTPQSERWGNKRRRLTSEVMRVPLSRMPTVEFEVATPVDTAGGESWALSGVPIAMTLTVTLHNPACLSSFQKFKFDQSLPLVNTGPKMMLGEAKPQNGQKLSLTGVVRDPRARY